jgi:hypothetical protein
MKRTVINSATSPFPKSLSFKDWAAKKEIAVPDFTNFDQRWDWSCQEFIGGYLRTLKNEPLRINQSFDAMIKRDEALLKNGSIEQ